MNRPEKFAVTHPPIQPNLARRWSPYALDPKPVLEEDLVGILEAARWAPSAFNEQPWRYLVARRTDEAAFAKLLSCLVEANQAWAKNAGVLLIGIARMTFTRNGKPNKSAHHDLGLAAGNICGEATARGLLVHQMVGIDPERVRDLYAVPADAEPLTAIAIGHVGDGAGLPDAYLERDRAERTRLPLESFVFDGAWDKAATFRRP